LDTGSVLRGSDENILKPNGEHTSAGLPIGWIKEEISYVVEATRIAKYDGTNWGAGGGASIGLDGKLSLTAFGGLTATFTPLTQASRPFSLRTAT
jgi:hypothetical protein